MRQIGTIPRRDLAERFQDYLIVAGMPCSLDPADDGVAVWIQNEDQLAAARAELANFLADPDAERYRASRQKADEILREAAARRKAAQQRTVQLSRQWSSAGAQHFPVTIGILIACVLVFAETWALGDKRNVMELFFFSKDGTWSAIQQGEWWRIFTPVLMHGGPMHIFFNLLWWWDLGRLIEARKGSLQLLLLTLAVAAFSDILQFEFGGPWFLGLSGVVFGLFGYTWVKGKLDPADGIGISDQSAMWMMIWFVACCFGVAGRIANWAHFGGLAMGMAWGCVSAAWNRWRHH